MENNEIKFSTADIIKLLVKKSKLIICLALVAAIIGGAAGVVLGLNDRVYGNSVDFYLTKADTTGQLLPLLESESFAEKLLLDEYGLPENLAGSAEYEAAKSEVIKLNELREAFRQITKQQTQIKISLTTPKDAAGNTITSWTIIEETYSALKSNYESLNNQLLIYKSPNADTIVDDNHKQETQRLETEVNAARAEMEQYRISAYEPAKLEINRLDDESTRARIAVNTQRDIASQAVEGVVSKWRNNEEIQAKVSKIADSLTVIYATPAESVSATQQSQSNANNAAPANAFIKVVVQVENDAELADSIIDALKTRLPSFVENNLERLLYASTVSCMLISPARSAEQLETGSMISDALVLAAVAAIAVVALVGAIIILKEWLRANSDDNTQSKPREAQSESAPEGEAANA